jgi:hypothetical protein
MGRRSISQRDGKSYRALLSALRNDFKQWLVPMRRKRRSPANSTLRSTRLRSLNGEALSKIGTAPWSVRSIRILYPNAIGDPDLDLIDASEGGAMPVADRPTRQQATG